MNTKLPASDVLNLACRRRSMSLRGIDVRDAGAKPGLWTGTREGLVATVIAVAAAMVFGGAAGAWFAPGDSGWIGQALKMAGGSMLMAALVCAAGSMLAGRNAIFWGVGMPLLVYGAGAFCAFISGHAGALMFVFGAPLFCGLSVMAGALTAFAAERGRLSAGWTAG